MDGPELDYFLSVYEKIASFPLRSFYWRHCVCLLSGTGGLRGVAPLGEEAYSAARGGLEDSSGREFMSFCVN